MYRSITIFLLCFFIANLYAQKITPVVLSNAGAVMKANNVSIEWTLGELATETLKANNLSITQGFHQTNLTLVSTSNPQISGLDLYPNPVANDLIISNQSGKTLHLHLMSITGQCISDHTYLTGEHTLPMNELAPGMYILEARTDDVKQHFTIEKIK